MYSFHTHVCDRLVFTEFMDFMNIGLTGKVGFNKKWHRFYRGKKHKNLDFLTNPSFIRKIDLDFLKCHFWHLWLKCHWNWFWYLILGRSFKCCLEGALKRKLLGLLTQNKLILAHFAWAIRKLKILFVFNSNNIFSQIF